MKKDLKINAIRYFLKKGELTASELSALLGSNRNLTSKLLYELVDGRVLEKQGRKYSLSKRMAVLVISLRSERAELVTFYPGSAVERRELPMSPSKTYGENIELISETVISHAAFLRKEYETVKICAISPGKHPVPLSAYERLGLIRDRGELLAAGLDGVASGSVIYLSKLRGISLVFKDGQVFSLTEDLPDDIASALSASFSLITPDVLLLDRVDENELEKIKAVCEEYSVKLLLTEYANELRLFDDEREIIASCIAK